MPVKQDDVLPPEEAPDASSKLFREYAAEFAELARNATSADQRILLLKMANIWRETTIRWEKDLLKDQEKLRRDNAQEPREPFPSNTGCALVDQNLIHRIRERAYEIWAANGYRDGEAEQDWLRAEREILDASTATAPKRGAIVADAGVFVA